MPNLKEIVKLTKEQMETLKNGGSVGNHTLRDDVLYAVEVTEDGSIQYYDTIISNQEEFEAWYKELDADTYEGHSVLFLNGTYTRSDGKGLHLPETLNMINGIGKVLIKIINFSFVADTNLGGIWYSAKPDLLAKTEEYSIKNLSVSCAGVSNLDNNECTAFINCVNLVNCRGSGSSTLISTSGYGFKNCSDLVNCYGLCNSYSGIMCGFYNCSNLTDCYGSSGGYSPTTAYGFLNCINLNNCTGAASSATSQGTLYGFHSCSKLSNCNGSVSGSSVVLGYSFYACNICSNCVQTPKTTSKTATWGGTNTNVDYDTCPEYPDPRVFPPIPTTQDNGKVLGVVGTSLKYVDKGGGGAFTEVVVSKIS